MRALLWIVLVAAAAWGGYWWVGSTAVQSGVVAWFDQQTQAGGVARHDGVAVRGFPNRFDLTVDGLELADPATGIGWQAPFVQVFSMSWKPWHLIAALSPGQVIVLPDQRVTVDGVGMKASVQVHPTAQLGLYETRAEAGDVTLHSDQGWSVAVARVFASTLEIAPNTHRLGLSLENLTPDPSFLTGSTLPEGIETLHLDATARLSAAIDRDAAQTRPMLMDLQVADLRVIWGALQITAEGALQAGPDGLAEGELAIKVAGWRHLPRVMAALGAINPDMIGSVERGLEVMAEAGADPEVLSLSLTSAGGKMTLGPLPLGPALRMR